MEFSEFKNTITNLYLSVIGIHQSCENIDEANFNINNYIESIKNIQTLSSFLSYPSSSFSSRPLINDDGTEETVPVKSGLFRKKDEVVSSRTFTTQKKQSSSIPLVLSDPDTSEILLFKCEFGDVYVANYKKCVVIAGNTISIKDAIKEIQNRKWLPSHKVWMFPGRDRDNVISEMEQITGVYGEEFEV